MALTLPNRPFGLRELDVAVWNAGTSSYGTPVKADASQELTVNIEADEATLEGDDVIKERLPFNRRATLSFNTGGLPLEFIAAITGAVLAETGTTPNQIKKVTVKGTDQPPYVRIRGRMVQASGGGDLLVSLEYARFFTGPQGNAAGGEFATSNFTGEAIPHPTTGNILTYEHRETAAALS